MYFSHFYLKGGFYYAKIKHNQTSKQIKATIVLKLKRTYCHSSDIALKIKIEEMQNCQIFL